MRILLVTPPWYCLQGQASSVMPLGLCYLAAVLREDGHQCLIYDGDIGFGDPKNEPGIIGNHDYYHKMMTSHPAWDKAERVVKEFDPDICGITFTTGAYNSAKHMTDIVKRNNRQTVVVLGGPHPTLMPEDSLREFDADIAVRGEGERAICQCAASIRDGKPLDDIEGITFKTADGRIISNPVRPRIKDLDSLPIPARDLLLDEDKYETIPIITGRGCPFKCTFCASNKIWGRKVRNRSLENIIAEIEQVAKKFPDKHIRFNDDTFTMNEKRVVGICDLIKERNIDIKWVCYGRVDVMTHRMLAEMKSAGCDGVFFGVESGNKEILESVQKGIKVEQVIDAFDSAKKLGIKASAYFMIGFPSETAKQVKDTIRLMKRIRPTGFCCWNIVTPYPGTELYEVAKKKGVLPEGLEWGDFFHKSEKINLSDMSEAEMHGLARRIERGLQRRKNRDNIKQKIVFGLRHPVKLLKKWKT